VELVSFRLEDYGIAYGYSPVLAALPGTLASEAGMVKAFLAATARGYRLAAADPKAAAALLLDQVAQETAACPLPEPLELGMLEESQVGRGARRGARLRGPCRPPPAALPPCRPAVRWRSGRVVPSALPGA
jgi:hypothetical protein